MLAGIRRKKIGVTCIAWVAMLAMVSVAWAEDVRWNLSGPLGAGQRATLELVFEGARPSGDVKLPSVDGLSVLGAPSSSTSTQMSFATGQGAEMRTTVTLGFPIRTERQGTVKIPSFEVQTDAGVVEVPGVSIVVGEPMLAGSKGSKNVRLEDVAAAEVRSSSRTPYAGEVIDLDLVVSVAGGRRGELIGPPVWNEEDAIAEPWGEGRAVRVDRRSGMLFKTRAVVEIPGSAVLAPVEQEVAIETGKRRDPFGDAFGRMDSLFGSAGRSIFGRPEMARFFVSSEPVSLNVAPLPEPQPEGFAGAVGEFRLESKIVPENPTAGEPLTWTLSLEGTGNWPMGVELPPRSVPEDVRTIRPRIERDFGEGELFSGRLVEDLVLIPSREGEMLLDPVRFVYFDPMTNQYETLEVAPPRLEVGPGRVVAATPTAPVKPAAGKVQTVPAEAATIVSTDPVDSLPAELLTGSASGQGPLPMAWVAAASSVPLVGFTAYALLLGIRRARITDPRRSEREAWASAEKAVDVIASGAVGQEKALALLDWQLAVASLVGLDRATPTLSQLERLARAELDETKRSVWNEWVVLWEASDLALYSSEQELAPDWCTRAERQLSDVPRSHFNPLRGLRPRNLVPLATIALLLMWSPGAVKAEEGDVAALYSEGAFTEARDLLVGKAHAQPNDWVARYNLGLVQAQLENPGTALAETTAAFLYQPRNAAVRWNLAWLADGVRGGGAGVAVAKPIRDLAFGAAWGLVARLASPFGWQVFGLVGVGVFCVGAALLLRGRHRPSQGAGTRWTGRGALAVGTLALAVSLLSLQQYGILARPNAAMVAESGVLRSVPTEAQEEQAQRPIAAGTLVEQTGRFLGWVKVQLPSGESGWLREDVLVPFYESPPA